MYLKVSGMIKSLIITGLIFVSSVLCCAKTFQGSITYNSYRGLVMAGYQGWHSAEGDGANRGWHHYEKSPGNLCHRSGF